MSSAHETGSVCLHIFELHINNNGLECNKYCAIREWLNYSHIPLLSDIAYLVLNHKHQSDSASLADHILTNALFHSAHHFHEPNQRSYTHLIQYRIHLLDDSNILRSFLNLVFKCDGNLQVLQPLLHYHISKFLSPQPNGQAFVVSYSTPHFHFDYISFQLK
jgi:hypothetical protein